MRHFALGTATLYLAILAAAGAEPARATQAPSILFIGNSFTFADGSPVHFYRDTTVVDLNEEGNGGVPALFKVFAAESGLSFDVSLETHPGVGLDWHLANKRGVLARRPYDAVVMQGYSTLDADKPGDPAKLVATTQQMADLLRSVNPAVEIHLLATWPRADQTYQPSGHWLGKTIDVMARDVGAAYDKAATGAAIKSVIPLGQAFLRAFSTNVADPNPYDGIDAGKVNLWTYDGYHASTFGYYLEALMDFGAVTKRDPRSLGSTECAAFELGMSESQAKAMQDIAYQELLNAGVVLANTAAPGGPQRRAKCPR